MSKFDVKEKIDKWIYRSYNFLSEALFLLNPKIRRKLKKNNEFKNIHLGQRCFILGTGPSLSKLDSTAEHFLKTEIIIGVNSLYKSDIGARLTPTYYTLMDNLYWEQWCGTFKEVQNAYPNRTPTFITDLRAQKFIEELQGHVKSMYIYSKKYPVDQMSQNLEGNIFAAMNVVSYSILSAIYMGFKEVYLLGCDYSAFCSAGKGHCYDDQEEVSQTNYNLAFYLKFYWITTEFHYLIAKLAKQQNVKIINLTPGSLLDAYPRTTMESALFGSQPR